MGDRLTVKRTNRETGEVTYLSPSFDWAEKDGYCDGTYLRFYDPLIAKLLVLFYEHVKPFDSVYDFEMEMD